LQPTIPKSEQLLGIDFIKQYRKIEISRFITFASI